jgi:hypothetical protein
MYFILVQTVPLRYRGVNFGGWILGGGSLNFGLILKKKAKKKQIFKPPDF